MANTRFAAKKRLFIGRMLLEGTANIRQASLKLSVSRNTVKRYIKKYELLAKERPEDPLGKKLPVTVIKTEYPASDKYLELMNILPLLIKHGEVVTVTDVWQKYLNIYPNGYRRSAFSQHFSKWTIENKIARRKRSLVSEIPYEDLKILKRWRNSSDRRKWERAVVIVESFKGRSAVDISTKVDRGADKVSD